MSWLKTFFGTTQHEESATKGTTPIDVIVYTASLASSPKAIDPILDGLREVTSKTAVSKLTIKDQAMLGEVYVKLESYLINQDPLRVFNKKELQQKISDKFFAAPTPYQEFWKTAGF